MKRSSLLTCAALVACITIAAFPSTSNAQLIGRRLVTNNYYSTPYASSSYYSAPYSSSYYATPYSSSYYATPYSSSYYSPSYSYSSPAWNGYSSSYYPSNAYYPNTTVYPSAQSQTYFSTPSASFYTPYATYSTPYANYANSFYTAPNYSMYPQTSGYYYPWY